MSLKSKHALKNSNQGAPDESKSLQEGSATLWLFPLLGETVVFFGWANGCLKVRDNESTPGSISLRSVSWSHCCLSLHWSLSESCRSPQSVAASLQTPPDNTQVPKKPLINDSKCKHQMKNNNLKQKISGGITSPKKKMKEKVNCVKCLAPPLSSSLLL